MFYEELQIKQLKLLQSDWSRVISFDLETHVLDPTQFLKNERILSISFARSVSGRFTEGQGIETKTLFLEKEDDESEKKLLEKLDDEFSRWKSGKVVFLSDVFLCSGLVC
jgi:FAD synthase